MNLTPPAGVAEAIASTFESTATVTRRGDATFDRAAHAIVDDTPATVYVGPCSYSGPKSMRRSTAGADERTVSYRIVSIPLDAASLHLGDDVSVDALVDPMVIDEVLGGTHKARNRYRCVATSDAPGVPT